MINIFLDLDNTLISSEPLDDMDDITIHLEKILKFDFKIMDDIYIVCARPHLQTFLDFIFKHFKVNVWTAASKSYAIFVINEFILKKNPSRQLNYIFFDKHCKASQRKYNTIKKLQMIWSKFSTQLNSDNTFIIDDLDEVCDIQPENCFHIAPFDFLNSNSENDKELLKMIKTLKKKFHIK